jgi:hypothetical protein
VTGLRKSARHGCPSGFIGVAQAAWAQRLFTGVLGTVMGEASVLGTTRVSVSVGSLGSVGACVPSTLKPESSPLLIESVPVSKWRMISSSASGIGRKRIRPQLAGSLNRAGGDPVIYIIGIDEKTGDIQDVSDTDVLTWWGQITPKFDQTPPEMVRHISVPVGADGEHVVAVAFASDRAPYVVKTGSANPSLEVPTREGTGTRSARRDELLRLLIPTVSVPHAVVLEAELYIEEHFPTEGLLPYAGLIQPTPKREFYTYGSFRVFIEHNEKELVNLPAHGMQGRLLVVGNVLPCKVRQARDIPAATGEGILTAVAANYDGITVSGPGAVSFDLGLPDLDSSNGGWFEGADSVHYEVELNVLHAIRPLRVNITLERTEYDWDLADGENKNQKTIGRWACSHPGLWNSYHQ